MTDEPPPVRYAVQGHIALVTLDRPARRNAVNAALAGALAAAVRQADADPEVRVVLLTSSADAVFCAGADLAAVAAGEAGGIATPDGGFAGFVFAARRKPWIAVVEGTAVGGGFEIALACDMIVASRAARFGLPEVKRGLIATGGGIHRLATALPRNLANELLASGEMLDAERAHQFGLLNRLTAPGEALAAAQGLAATIAVNGPLAVQATLAAVRTGAVPDDVAGRRIMLDEFAALRASADYAEGPRAFVEKRAPVWTGR